LGVTGLVHEDEDTFALTISCIICADDAQSEEIKNQNANDALFISC
jgi:hypothetical protein